MYLNPPLMAPPETPNVKATKSQLEKEKDEKNAKGKRLGMSKSGKVKEGEENETKNAVLDENARLHQMRLRRFRQLRNFRRARMERAELKARAYMALEKCG
eukprot:CAMPEP_0167765202 /NCGR_PEP_ID=MMETSP0110_2-20121227/14533_1 /TAXON_ID=629695 /ORGANISM="Gymnochlora sp., Strain CCMP2014" /LENGTH=100 /DNA_ID=CAMNT_0007652843 /DNA_START=561 /DNA_END=860 /DNA_ORIENTATION=-